MLYPDGLELMFKDGADSLWRTVAATPEDKLDWRPAPDARTARELLEEVVMTTGFTAKLLETQAMPDMDGASAKQSLAEMEKAHREGIQELLKALREFPEDKLQESLDMPWGKTTFFQSAICEKR